MRLMPDFIVIGAQRCGTTSLYNNLIKHPNVSSSFVKEVHYFDVNFEKGMSWYKSHFPSHLYKYIRQAIKQDFVTGEASPYYIFHPHAPRRIAEVAPYVKLMLMLRNPIDRAYSHYHHEARQGFETLSFKDAVEKEQERLLGETEKMLGDESYCSFNHRHYSYLSRGIYVDQVREWAKWFSKDQLLILKSEDFYHEPKSIIQQVIAFLGLPDWEPMKYTKFNASNYPQMDAAIRTYLIDFFRPYNQRLYEYLGADLGWDR
jgi:hypothetical protein